MLQSKCLVKFSGLIIPMNLMVKENKTVRKISDKGKGHFLIGIGILSDICDLCWKLIEQ